MEALIFILKAIGFGVLGGIAAIVVPYILMCILGFTYCGVRKDSAAARYQPPDVESGSCFACCQSSGAAGCSWWCHLLLFIFGFVLTVVLLVHFHHPETGDTLVTLGPSNSTAEFNATTAMPLLL